MDEQKVLILTQQKSGRFENKTKDIVRIKEPVSGTEKYTITFKNNKPYTFGKSKVQYFKQPKKIDISQSVIRVKGGEYERWDSAIKFGPYIVLFRNEKSDYHLFGDIMIISNIAENDKTKSLVEYYRYIADLLKGQSKHLDIYYKHKLKFIRQDSVVRKFADKSEFLRYKTKETPIFPFGVNLSQRQAIIYALENQVSLIQGPPGTGKTQTILNIIANLIVQKKTIAIVAGNNSATANIDEKLQKEGIDFIVAKLGNKELQSEFFATDHTIPDISCWALDNESNLKLKARLNSLDNELTQLLSEKNELAIVREKIESLAIEKHHFERYFDIRPVDLNKLSFANKWSTPVLLKFLAELEYYSQYIGLRWTVKLRWLYKYHIFRFKDLEFIHDDLIKGVIGRYYRQKLEELNHQKKLLEASLDKHNFDVMLKEYTELSLRVFKGYISRYYRNNSDQEKFYINSYKSQFSHFLKRFPVVLSTTDSVVNNKGPYDLFDYLIVDEASQVDLVSGLLAMSCAKNIVAVGDLKQLPHIPSGLVTECIDEAFDVQAGYSYLHYNLLSSLNTVFFDAVPLTLLKEHYRCHPMIIGFCNQKFYGGQLVIMTDIIGEPFKIFKTVSGNHARRSSTGKSLLNQRELDVITNEVLNFELSQKSRNSIGIATPYRAQADRARKSISNGDVQIDTVYKYQGREKDTIILSTTSNNLNKFVDDPHLLNVAVSRAKRQFILVTSRDIFKDHGSNIGDLIRYIEYQSVSDSVFESKTVSIFDCLYADYSDVLKSFSKGVKKTSKFTSENLMIALLEDILKDERYSSFAYKINYSLNLLVQDFIEFTDREKEFVLHPNSHVDLLLYNKLDKTPFLAIEVDGYQYHELDKTQSERDECKDSVFNKLGIRLERFSTIGSGEKEKLEGVINLFLNSIPESQEETIHS
ncbi:AAA domain-containing protein [Kiloniella sp.]|uniref:AAA domain-containing protein n=1 Tax=Kiloniella sp. TaxID=1938587 RepID=UPI003A935F81